MLYFAFFSNWMEFSVFWVRCIKLNSNLFKNRQKIEAIRMLPSLLSSSHGNLIQKQRLMSGVELDLSPERVWFTQEPMAKIVLICICKLISSKYNYDRLTACVLEYEDRMETYRQWQSNDGYYSRACDWHITGNYIFENYLYFNNLFYFQLLVFYFIGIITNYRAVNCW